MIEICSHLRNFSLIVQRGSGPRVATCGLYGLMAYAVTQRRREIGVRMARAVGLTAAWVPARRATRIDPVAALRAE